MRGAFDRPLLRDLEKYLPIYPDWLLRTQMTVPWPSETCYVVNCIQRVSGERSVVSLTATTFVMFACLSTCQGSHARRLDVYLFYANEKEYTKHRAVTSRKLPEWILGLGLPCSACWCRFCAMPLWSLPESKCSPWITPTSLIRSPNTNSLSSSSMLHGVPVNLFPVLLI